MLEQAVELAKLGCYPLPLYPKEKRPALNKWQEITSSDVEAVRLQFAAVIHHKGGCNLGLLMGRRSGMLGLDIDYDEGADREFIKSLPISWTVKTGKGHHVYYTYPASWPDIGCLVVITGQNKAKNGKAKPCVSIRGNGHQFAIPPSIHPETGQAYSWAKYEGWAEGIHCDTLSPGEVPLALPPDWLLEKHFEKAERDAGSSCEWAQAPHLSRKPSNYKYGEGERHAMFVATASSMRSEGASFDEIAQRLRFRSVNDCAAFVGRRNVEAEIIGVARWAVATVRVDDAKARRVAERLEQKARRSVAGRGASSPTAEEFERLTSAQSSTPDKVPDAPVSSTAQLIDHALHLEMDAMAEKLLQPPTPVTVAQSDDPSSWPLLSEYEQKLRSQLPVPQKTAQIVAAPGPAAALPVNTTSPKFEANGPIIPLGHLGNDYFYLSEKNRQITRMSYGGHTENGLMNLMPIDYWRSKYGHAGRNGVVVDWKEAASDLMASGWKAGIFNARKMRGEGGWQDGENIVLHLGDTLRVGMAERDLLAHSSPYTYRLGPSISAPGAEEASEEDRRVFLEACSAPSWEKPSSALLLAGWLSLARLSGALPWRPHLWISGPAGSGKSKLMNSLISGMLGDWCLKGQADSSAAGIRGRLQCSALPVWFDEGETNDKKSGALVRAVVNLARSASSDSDAEILKGTPDGKGYSFNIRSCFVMASIRVNLTGEADRGRFAVLELTNRDHSDPDGYLKRIEAVGAGLADRLFVRVLRRWGMVRENYALLKRAIHLGAGGSARLGDQYGMLLAGYAVMQQDTVLTEAEAAGLIQQAGIVADSRESDNEPDHVRCLNSVLTSNFYTGLSGQAARSYTVGDLIEMAQGNEYGDARAALRNIGISVDDNWLYIANHHSELLKILRDTPYAEGNGIWGPSLARIFGAKKSKKRFGGGQYLHCVQIPLEFINKEE